MTPFSSIFEIFFNQITDDLYCIFDEKETEEDLILLLKQSIPQFEFPKTLLDINLEEKCFVNDLSMEEINILASIMVKVWLKRATQDQRLIRLEYGDKDFSMGNQSTHLKILDAKLKDIEQEIYYMQRLYNRRTKTGQPNYSGIAGKGG